MDLARTLADLAAAPDAWKDLPDDALPGVLGVLEELRARAWRRMNRPRPRAEPANVAEAPADRQRLLTADEVAERLGISKARVYQLTRRDEIPHVRLGTRQVRYDPAAIEAFLAEGGSE